jgi:Siphovirus Gp157
MTENSLAPLPVELSLEKLSEIFEGLVRSVQAQVEAENPTAHAKASDETRLAVQEVLNAQIERRDEISALIHAVRERAVRLRTHANKVEQMARSYESSDRSLCSSIELYMIEAGLKRIEGFSSRFSIYKKPEQLQITDEKAIPKKYWKRVKPVPVELDKGKLLNDLHRGKIVPGAHLERDAVRLDVK